MEKAIERERLLSIIEELQNKIDTYDEVYSDGDEFTSKQDLEDQLFKLQSKLKEIETV